MANTPCPKTRHGRLLWGRSNHHQPTGVALPAKSYLPQRAKPAAKTSVNSSIRSPRKAKLKVGTSPPILSESSKQACSPKPAKCHALIARSHRRPSTAISRSVP
jgi:hypothetical protein